MLTLPLCVIEDGFQTYSFRRQLCAFVFVFFLKVDKAESIKEGKTKLN